MRRRGERHSGLAGTLLAAATALPIDVVTSSCHKSKFRHPLLTNTPYTTRCCSRKHSAHYDVVLVSPRNYFLYTPLLPAVAAGSMEERSIVQPVRQIMNDKVGFGWLGWLCVVCDVK